MEGRFNSLEDRTEQVRDFLLGILTGDPADLSSLAEGRPLQDADASVFVERVLPDIACVYGVDLSGLMLKAIGRKHLEVTRMFSGASNEDKTVYLGDMMIVIRTRPVVNPVGVDVRPFRQGLLAQM